MRSRAARLTFGAAAWIALAAAGVFIVRSEKEIAAKRGAFRAFDQHAREATEVLADLRAGQQAYVAAGQGLAFWIPKVGATLDTATATIAGLNREASTDEARSALAEASTALADFRTADRRARDYVNGDQQLMAADVIFTEGSADAMTAGRTIESARLTERQALDAREAMLRQREAMAAGGAVTAAVLATLLLIPLPRREEIDETAAATTAASAGTADLPMRIAPPPAPTTNPPPRAAAPVLQAAAQLCTDFGRIIDPADLTGLLGRAADMMDASGLVLWVGSSSGADLRPVLAHGYAPSVLARMPAVPRNADNAAAAAYRTGTLQIVLARPGSAPGAVVAPVLTGSGCVGALSAEIRGGGETSDAVHALATIFAAQLASVVAVGPAETSEPKAASAS